MKFLRKWGILFVSIFFVAAIIILILFSKKSMDELKLGIAERDEQIVTLETSLTDIGPCALGYVLNTDVRAGESVNKDYFVQVSVPEKLGLNIFTQEMMEAPEIDLAYFRTSLKEGTVITTEDINYQEIKDSERYVDVVLDQLPIGVMEGNYIDIRITFPYGEDFIALSNKKIEQINSGILKLILDENEIAVYNSLLLDRILYSGTQIYAVEYVDAGSQDRAETFYPINDTQSELLLENPNALEISKQEMILKRQIVENTLGGNILKEDKAGLTEEELEDLTDQLENINDKIDEIRANTQDRVISADEVVQERRQLEAERAAMEEEGEVSSGEAQSYF